MKQADDIWAKLQVLRQFTADQGFLHQGQIDQLKLWGRLAFQKFKSQDIEINIDFENKDVKYTLKNGKLAKMDHQAKLVAGLDGSIAHMLGDEWRLLINLDGKDIYTGPRRSVEPIKKTKVKKNARRRTRKSTRRTRRS